jgi:hypothetical protein
VPDVASETIDMPDFSRPLVSLQGALCAPRYRNSVFKLPGRRGRSTDEAVFAEPMLRGTRPGLSRNWDR